MLQEENLKWLDWARKIQSIAQTGLHYSENEFDRDRYSKLMQLSAEIVSSYSDQTYESLLGTFLSQKGYSTPKVDVRAAVFKDGKILMVREMSDGCWAMPGGWADVGDLPSESAEREVLEEAGFKVKSTRVIGVYDANRDGARPIELFHAVKLVFLCDLHGGEAAVSYETTAVGFFGLDEIPPLSSMRTNLRMIKDAFTANSDPLLPTIYD